MTIGSCRISNSYEVVCDKDNRKKLKHFYYAKKKCYISLPILRIRSSLSRGNLIAYDNQGVIKIKMKGGSPTLGNAVGLKFIYA